MKPNRSIPDCTVIPELAYADVGRAAQWLCDAFGFTVRLRIANHRVQLNVGDGAIVVTEHGAGAGSPAGAADHGVMVRVEDVDVRYRRAQECAARIVRPPTDYPFGERQCTIEDPGGHRWTFTETIGDIDPAEWGGVHG